MTQMSRSHRIPLRALCVALVTGLAGAPMHAPAASLRGLPSEQKVTVNFVNAEIEAVSRAMSAILKRPILVDPRVKGTMTLYSEEPLTPRETLVTYMATLRGLGFAVIEASGLLKVIPEAEAKTQTGAVVVGKTQRQGDQIVTQVFQLRHENANSLVAVLRPLITPNNTINANPGSNSLVITDYADNLQRLGKLIAALDTPGSTDVEVIAIRHAVASDLAPIVQRFADGGGAAAGAAGAGNAAGGGASVVADSRTNALLVRAASSAKLAQIRSTIEKLDRPNGAGDSGNIHVVYLKNADATRLATVLRAAYAAQNTGAGASGAAATGGGASPAPTANGSNGTSGTSASGASTQSTSPVTAAASPSTGGFVQADPATNSLIITAPEPMYRQLRAVIDQLDARRAQVYVESMIVKMDAAKAAQLGFQWQGLLSNNSNSAGIVAGTNYSTGTSTNLVDLTVAAATGAASSLSLGAGLNIGLINKIAGGYTVGALANFLASETGANILSTPNLVTLDNEEAKIVIGQNVPFITGTYTSTGTSNSSVNPFQTVERKDVGLTLRVKPQIGENGTVRMTIYQENSSVVESTTSNSAGPRTDKSAIETTVVVDDGQMLVLGGLLKDEYSDGEDRVPGLSKIPYLGALFRSDSRKRTKTNLMVFLRPVVMRGPADANQLTLDRYDAIRAAQQAAQPRPSAAMEINDAPILPARPATPRGAPPPLASPIPPGITLVPESPPASSGSAPTPSTPQPSPLYEER